MQNIFLTGYSQAPRHQSIESIKSWVAAYGDIVDFNLFSDLAISVKIEIPEASILPLHQALRSIIALDDYDAAPSLNQRERTLFLHIHFAQGSGEASHERPIGPG